jgi:hypothetical protein
MRFLYAAYVATWLIHISYLLILTRGFLKIREEIRQLKRSGEHH